MEGFYLIRCEECRRLWVGQPSNRGRDSYGICGAQGPSHYTCKGKLRRPSEEADEFGLALEATWRIGSWEGVVALIETNPGWAWVKNQGYYEIPDIHQPKCGRCGLILGAWCHSSGAACHEYHSFELEQ